jgi:ribonuclease I
MNKIYILLLCITGLYVSNSSYSPTKCTPTNYDLTFLYDNNSTSWKIHGIWPEICAECTTCGYPQCCNINNVKYEYPNDPTNFIQQYWYNVTTKEECLGLQDVILFEHEYYKHISCSNIGNTTSYLNLMIQLYKKYYSDYIVNQCNGSDQLWINLDQNFNYIKTTCK